MPKVPKIKGLGALPSKPIDEVTEGVLKNLPGDRGQPSAGNFFDLPSVKNLTKDLNDLNIRETADAGVMPEAYTAKEIFEGNGWFKDIDNYLNGTVDIDDIDDSVVEVIMEMKNTYKMSNQKIKSILDEAIK
tara:strand:- start:2490 stop:2885 length:396 start_codon:yes stop_codon:yes gene_type:complete